jgi:hypothetical protein
MIRARIGHGQRKAGRHRGIDGIAAPPQDIGADPRSDFLLRDHHAVFGGYGMNGVGRSRYVPVAFLRSCRQAKRDHQCDCRE